MNELGLYDTPEEIADAILSKVNSLGTIRKATINSKCNNEIMLTRFLICCKDKGRLILTATSFSKTLYKVT